jgi:hypothetical protein
MWVTNNFFNTWCFLGCVYLLFWVQAWHLRGSSQMVLCQFPMIWWIIKWGCLYIYQYFLSVLCPKWKHRYSSSTKWRYPTFKSIWESKYTKQTISVCFYIWLFGCIFEAWLILFIYFNIKYHVFYISPVWVSHFVLELGFSFLILFFIRMCFEL